MLRKLLCLLLLVNLSFAQNSKQLFRKLPVAGIMKITVGAGMTYYLGDLSDQLNTSNIRPHFSVGGNYRLNERVALRGEFRYYQITGTQAGTRNWYNQLSFKGNNFDMNVGAQFELRKYSYQPRFNPYLFGGVGLTYFNPKARLDGVWYSLPPLRTEGVGYSQISAIYLAGLGFSFRINDTWAVGVELSDNFAATDYLDDVSTVYPTRDGMSAIALALSDRRPENGLPPNDPGNIRGNPNVNDSYGMLSFKAEYFIGSSYLKKQQKRLKCAKF